MDLQKILNDHQKWLYTCGTEGCCAHLSGANLSGVDLSYARLNGTDLSDADLSGADLDYSCLPLWCGSLGANFDDRQLIQFTYHLVSAGLQSKNASEAVKQELSKLIGLANQFHRVQECGYIKNIGGKSDV